jgi:hypothetical protein
MEIDLVTLNEDGSIAFSGKINADSAKFILNVGVNFLMQQGAQIFAEDEDEIDEFLDDMEDENTTNRH